MCSERITGVHQEHYFVDKNRLRAESRVFGLGTHQSKVKLTLLQPFDNIRRAVNYQARANAREPFGQQAKQ